jgi:hypothetical protein
MGEFFIINGVIYRIVSNEDFVEYFFHMGIN